MGWPTVMLSEETRLARQILVEEHYDELQDFFCPEGLMEFVEVGWASLHLRHKLYVLNVVLGFSARDFMKENVGGYCRLTFDALLKAFEHTCWPTLMDARMITCPGMQDVYQLIDLLEVCQPEKFGINIDAMLGVPCYVALIDHVRDHYTWDVVRPMIEQFLKEQSK